MESMALIGWIIATIVLMVIEASTVNLVSVWFAIGTFAAAIVAAFGGGYVLQIVVFVVISVLVLIFTKPVVKKMREKNAQATNADRIIGKEAEVTEEIDPISGSGQIKVLGQTWSAKAEGNLTVSKKARVRVLRIEGVKAVVKEEEKE